MMTKGSTPAKGHMTGMLGVYLTAAELTKRSFIASPTSRSAFGADILVTDQRCRKAWSVQVKTNRKPAGFWLVSPHVADTHSESHVYVFVNLKDSAAFEYFVVPSTVVARVHQAARAKGGLKQVWYAVNGKDILDYAEEKGWTTVFGDASTPLADEIDTAVEHDGDDPERLDAS